MGRHSTIAGASFVSRSDSDSNSGTELDWPFGRIDSIDRDDLRETAYELFFTSCRSSPGFGGRSTAAVAYSPASVSGSQDGGSVAGDGSPGGTVRGGVGMVVNSKIKRALGLKARKAPPMRTMNQTGSTGREGSGGAVSPAGRVKRPMTSAEIMRQQMRVTEQSDHRLRKTIMRTLIGQPSRRAETIVLPLELLRQLKPSEFNDTHEYHVWQKRQLKILESGLLLHPSTPLDRLNSSALRLREVIRSSELKPIDTSKNSETMRILCDSVVSLAWRSSSSSPTDVCHWADGFPLNVHLYLSLLHSIFDFRDETVILDEVDELIELMKKTWSILGINRMLHNLCFTWVLFQQFIVTGQAEPDLLYATLVMLAEVANDVKKGDREFSYVKVLSSTLASMQGWAEKKLSDYHEHFDKGSVGVMEIVISLALSAAKMITEDVSSMGVGTILIERENGAQINSSGNKVEYFIRASLRNAFTKVFENGNGNGNVDSMVVEVDEDPSEVLIELAKGTEDLVMEEKEIFSIILKRWHPVPIAVAVATLHSCYGIVLKQYLARVSSLTNESVRVLQTAGKLEKMLVQMVVEDCADYEDGGKSIVREMTPYEVDSIFLSLMKTWVEERLMMGRECLNKAKETESWNTKSKTEPYAQSAMALMKVAKVTIDEFFEIPVGARDDLVQEIADGLEILLQDYASFTASCGSKQSYIPTLPPLTRCNQNSKFAKLWKSSSCNAGVMDPPNQKNRPADGQTPRPSTSRGTQRLYIRLNTLHYLLAHLQSLDKSLALFHRNLGPSPSPRIPNRRRTASSSHFDLARSSIQSAIQYVAEVTAYRLIFLDSHHSFYDGLYLGSVETARIRPGLRILKQNITLLITVLTDRAQPLAVKEVMKASFEAFLLVLLAGGSERAFMRSDHETILEDFRSLKRLISSCGEGLVPEEMVDREGEVVEGIIGLMGQSTEKLVEDFSVAARKASGLRGAGQRLPMPPTTGRWSRSDPNTILRVLCHRNDDASNSFLKRTFQLPKRRS